MPTCALWCAWNREMVWDIARVIVRTLLPVGWALAGWKLVSKLLWKIWRFLSSAPKCRCLTVSDFRVCAGSMAGQGDYKFFMEDWVVICSSQSDYIKPLSLNLASQGHTLQIISETSHTTENILCSESEVRNLLWVVRAKDEHSRAT